MNLENYLKLVQLEQGAFCIYSIYYDPQNLIKHRPVYMIDTSKHKITFSILKLKSQKNVICYAIVLSEKLLENDVIKNDIP